MKISTHTLNVFKNFAKINQNLYVEKGSTLRTMSPSRNLLAEVEVEEEFPVDFGVYNLNLLLQVQSLFRNPEWDFSDNFVTISNGDGDTNEEARLVFNRPETLLYPKKKLTLPDHIYEFTLTEEVLGRIEKVSSTFSMDKLLVRGDNEKVDVVINNGDIGETASCYTINISTGDYEEHFGVEYKIEYLKFLPHTYNANVAAMPDNEYLTKFESSDGKNVYFVT